MSWNVTKAGPVKEVKATLDEAFENAKKGTESFPIENLTVGKAHEIVTAIIDEAIAGERVNTISVAAYGSASRNWDTGKDFATSFNLKVEFGFKNS